MAGGARTNIASEERPGRGFRQLTDRAADEDVEESEGAGGPQHAAQLARHGLEGAHGLVEPHHLDDPQIVEGADHRGENTYDGQPVELRVDRGEEDIPLGPEAGER